MNRRRIMRLRAAYRLLRGDSVVYGVKIDASPDAIGLLEIPAGRRAFIAYIILLNYAHGPALYIQKLTDIYNDIFLDQLEYEDFLVSLGREYWCVGEAFPLGSFDEDLGIWDHGP